MIEDWSTIPGYDDRLEVSTFGRVRSWAIGVCSGKRRLTARVLRGSKTDGTNASRYPHVGARRLSDGKVIARRIHGLVLDAFLGPRPPGMYARHRDGNPNNNHIANLSYATQSENLLDRRIHGTANRGERNGRARFTEANVIEMRAARRDGLSYRRIGLQFGTDARHAMAIVTGETWGHVDGAVPRSGVCSGSIRPMKELR